MADKITRCQEEEYSFFVSTLWRRAAGWKPLLMYFRGPGGVPFFIAPLLSAVGLWRFARRPRRLADCEPSVWEQATVTGTDCCLGSYGMGGPGFVGIRLRPRTGPRLWVVFTIWAAAEWLTLDGELLEESYFLSERGDSSRRFLPLAALQGARLIAVGLTADAAELTFARGGAVRALRLQRDSSHLPVHRGSKAPKVLGPDLDLRDAVVVSRRGGLWLDD